MKARREILISLLFYIPLGGLLAYINFNGDILKALIFGYIGALSVFFVPYLFRRARKKKLSA